MVATRGRTFKRPWRRSCLSSKLKSSSAPIGRKDSWCFHAVGSSNAPLLGSTAAEGLPRIGRTSIATRWRSCGLPQSASCSENFVIPPDVFGQTLSLAGSYPGAVRLQLHALAYNLANFLRTLATPEPMSDWSLTTLKEKLIKIGAKVVSHGRYIVFQMAEVAMPRQMIQEILRLIAELRLLPPSAPA